MGFLIRSYTIKMRFWNTASKIMQALAATFVPDDCDNKLLPFMISMAVNIYREIDISGVIANFGEIAQHFGACRTFGGRKRW